MASCEELEAFHDADYISVLAHATPEAVPADMPLLHPCENMCSLLDAWTHKRRGTS